MRLAPIAVRKAISRWRPAALGEHQIGNVRAGNQQHKRQRAHHGRRDQRNIFRHKLILERSRLPDELRIDDAVLLVHARRHVCQIEIRLFRRYATSETGHNRHNLNTKP